MGDAEMLKAVKLYLQKLQDDEENGVKRVKFRTEEDKIKNRVTDWKPEFTKTGFYKKTVYGLKQDHQMFIDEMSLFKEQLVKLNETNDEILSLIKSLKSND